MASESILLQVTKEKVDCTLDCERVDTGTCVLECASDFRFEFLQYVLICFFARFCFFF